jgi:peptidyl-prolyl cis-trans isomerase D
MALIGSIRKNGWILIVLMTLALGGFILMEIISNAQRNSAGDINTLGKVNGAEVKRSDFEDYEKLIFANSKSNPYQIHAQSWNYHFEKALVDQLAEALGLNVGPEELTDLQFGNNISPIIAERFKGADGQPNRATLSSIKAAIEGGQFTDPTNRAYWAIQEKEVQKERLQSKINALVSKGVYTPSWQAEMSFRESNERVSFLYVRVPYDKVPDTEVQVTDADYSAFLKENPKLYDQTEETRVIQFVAFDVLPTAEDSAATYQGVASLVAGMKAATDDSTFILSNNGEIDPGFTSKSNLPASAADSMMRLPIGSVVGPFLENGTWNIVKIIDRKTVPDSVKARHILIREANPASEARIDSLKGLLESGKARFDSLAVANSQDPGSGAKGGDLGWFPQGAMVPEFNEVCFFKGEQGKFYKVATQFGWHLIEITGKKFVTNDPAVKASYISRRIEPSTNTQRVVKDKAIGLIETSDNMEQMIQKATEMGLQPQSSAPAKINDYALGALGSGDDARAVVRWAFDKKTEKGDVSKEVFSFRDASGGYFDAKYLVAGLQSIMPKGKATVESLKANPRVVQEVKNKKKAGVLTAKMQNVADLQTLAAQNDVKVDTAINTTILQAAVQNGGAEPKVVGAAFSAAYGAITGPIAGNSGVYFIQLISEKSQAQVPNDITLFRRQAQSTAVANLRIGLMNAIKKTADVDDRRSNFF